MRFAYYFPGRKVPADPVFSRAAALVGLARAAEQAGFDAVALDEHPIPSNRWRNTPGGHDSIDPFVGLAAVAAGTSDIRLLTYAAVLPYRNPFLLAKSVATLDVVSGGRVILGVAAGYMESEFQALGVDYARRNALFDQCLEAMKLAWSGEPVHYRGTDFVCEGNVAHPLPEQRPHPPVWIGGNGPGTRRRVVRHAQGWMSMPNPRVKGWEEHTSPPLESVQDLRGLLDGLRREAEAAGRSEPIDVAHSLRDAPHDHAPLVEHLAALRDAGVTWVTVNGTGRTPEEASERIARFGREVIAELGARPSATR
ncbi:LLM class F420-dependent oxidoreductase [Yinghuangia sp. YIM S09857]|uniref:LLM class F420-dependent oxidoreductase n=1 Tax=Yinghuangia sp. YIM S09857 TaxID=3436929 RepID=UPI003F52E542